MDIFTQALYRHQSSIQNDYNCLVLRDAVAASVENTTFCVINTGVRLWRTNKTCFSETVARSSCRAASREGRSSIATCLTLPAAIASPAIAGKSATPVSAGSNTLCPVECASETSEEVQLELVDTISYLLTYSEQEDYQTGNKIEQLNQQ